MQYLEQLRRASVPQGGRPPPNRGVPTSEDLDTQVRDILPKVRNIHAHGPPGGTRAPVSSDPPPPPLRRVGNTKRRRHQTSSSDVSEADERASAEDEPVTRKRAKLMTSSQSVTDDPDSAPMATLPAMAENFTIPHPVEEDDGESIFISVEESVAETRRLMRLYRRHRIGDRIAPENRCFLCEYGNPAYDKDPDYGCRVFTSILDYIAKHYGTSKNEAIGINAMLMYERGLFGPFIEYLRRRGMTLDEMDYPLPPMSVDMFVAHIAELHTLNPVFIVGETQRQIFDIQQIVVNRLVKRKTQGYESKAVNDFVKLATLQLRYLTTQTKNLGFNSGNADGLQIDPARAGGIANLDRIDSLLVKNGSTIGGRTAADSTTIAGDRSRPLFDRTDMDDGDDTPDDDDATSDRNRLRDLVSASTSAASKLPRPPRARSPPTSPLPHNADESGDNDAMDIS